MANFDQSGNPVDRNRTQGAQQGGASGTQAGGWQGSSGQQSQYSGNTQGQNASAQRGMQASSGRSAGAWQGGFPDVYGGFGGGPFQLISRLSDEMDRIFESFGVGSAWPRSVGRAGQSAQGGGQGLRTLWAPHIEVAERNGKLLIQADLPGVRKEDVNVQIEDDAVIIQGQRHQENERNEGGFYHSERSYGSFYRVIPLPDGTDAEQANATFRDGVLHIEVPVPQQRQRGRRLEIRDAGGGQQHLGSQAGWQQTQGATSAGQQQGQGTSHAQHGGTMSPGAQQQAEGTSERR